MTVYNIEDKRSFAEWLCTPPHVKRAAGLPTSKEAYSRARGITTKTLTRWEQGDKLFARVLEEAKQRWVEPPAPGDEPPHPAEGEVDPLKRDYAVIRETLVERAKEGDPKALDAFMRYYGKTLAEEEAAVRNSGLSGLSDDELVAQTLTLIGREKVLAWLG